MKNLCVVLLAAFAGLLPAAAAAQFQVGAGLAISNPGGGNAGRFATGVGLDITARYLLNTHMGLGLNTGYYSHALKSGWGHGYDGSLRYVPFAIAFDYYFLDGPLRPYLGAELGAYFLTYKDDWWWKDGHGHGYYVTGTRYHNTFAGLGLGGGVMYWLKENIALDAKLWIRSVASGSNGYYGAAANFTSLTLGIVGKF